MIPSGPKSVENDEVDSIYSEADPIDSSISIRKKAGNVQSVVPDKNAKVGKFFFALTYKGDPIPISELAKTAAAKEAGKTNVAGNVIIEEKPKVDPIDKSL